MKNIYFKLLLFALLNMLWPTCIQAEMLRTAENNTTEIPRTAIHTARTGELHLQKGKKFFHFLEKLKPGKKTSTKGKLIAGIIAMLILSILFVLIFIGLIQLSKPMGGAGQSDKTVFPFFALIFLIPPIFFILGISKNAKKIEELDAAEGQ